MPRKTAATTTLFKETYNVGSSFQQRRRRCALIGLVGIAVGIMIRLCRNDLEISDTVPRLPVENTAKKKSYMSNDDDGCSGFFPERDSPRVKAKWRSYRADEMHRYHAVQACIRRQTHIHKEYLAENFDLDEEEILMCGNDNDTVEASMAQLQSVLSRYNQLWFIGDSVLKEMFLVWICTVDPNLTNQQLVSNEDMQRPGRETIGHAVEFQMPLASDTTRILFSGHGLLWAASEINLYKQAFITATTETSNKGTAIIVNAGAVHFHSHAAHKLQRAVNFIAQRSTHTNATIFMVEPAPSEYPTSNGMFVNGCQHACQCQVLTEERIQGHGVLIPPPANKKEQKRKPLPPSPGLFEALYPYLKGPYRSETCQPDCLPATWRSDVIRQALLNNTNTHHKVHVVPTWWQLVDRGRINSVAQQMDCTHKTLSAIMNMNQQLLRKMVQVMQTEKRVAR